jgi:DNA-binding NarL/FixJ family response regulator
MKSDERVIKLVIVDDSAIVRERLASMFAELDAIQLVGQMQDGQEAINGIKKLQPDVVILDIRLPGISGIEVLQEIKKQDPALMVIILTNYPYDQYWKKCMDAGADAFLDKSTEFNRIVDIIKQVRQQAQSV